MTSLMQMNSQSAHTVFFHSLTSLPAPDEDFNGETQSFNNASVFCPSHFPCHWIPRYMLMCFPFAITSSDLSLQFWDTRLHTYTTVAV